MRNNLRIGLAFKRPPARGEFVAKLLEIFDDTIVHQRDFARRMRVRVACRRRAMRSPTRMRYADITSRVIGLEDVDEIGKLAFRAAANKLAIKHRANTRAIIAAIFHPLEPIDQAGRHG